GVSGGPGGAVNLVRKRPTTEWQTSGVLYAGRWSNYRAELDAGGPLSAGGAVRGRFVSVLADGNQFYDFSDTSKKLVSALVEADLAERTLLTAGGFFVRDEQTFWGYGLPRYENGDDLALPRASRLGGHDDHYVSDVYSVFARVSHEWDNGWSLG